MVKKKPKDMTIELIILLIIFILIYLLKSQLSGVTSFSPAEGIMAFINT